MAFPLQGLPSGSRGGWSMDLTTDDDAATSSHNADKPTQTQTPGTAAPDQTDALPAFALPDYDRNRLQGSLSRVLTGLQKLLDEQGEFAPQMAQPTVRARATELLNHARQCRQALFRQSSGERPLTGTEVLEVANLARIFVQRVRRWTPEALESFEHEAAELQQRLSTLLKDRPQDLPQRTQDYAVARAHEFAQKVESCEDPALGPELLKQLEAAVGTLERRRTGGTTDADASAALATSSAKRRRLEPPATWPQGRGETQVTWSLTGRPATAAQIGVQTAARHPAQTPAWNALHTPASTAAHTPARPAMQTPALTAMQPPARTATQAPARTATQTPTRTATQAPAWTEALTSGQALKRPAAAMEATTAQLRRSHPLAPLKSRLVSLAKVAAGLRKEFKQLPSEQARSSFNFLLRRLRARQEGYVEDLEQVVRGGVMPLHLEPGVVHLDQALQALKALAGTPAVGAAELADTVDAFEALLEKAAARLEWLKARKPPTDDQADDYLDALRNVETSPDVAALKLNLEAFSHQVKVLGTLVAKVKKQAKEEAAAAAVAAASADLQPSGSQAVAALLSPSDRIALAGFNLPSLSDFHLPSVTMPGAEAVPESECVPASQPFPSDARELTPLTAVELSSLPWQVSTLGIAADQAVPSTSDWLGTADATSTSTDDRDWLIAALEASGFTVQPVPPTAARYVSPPAARYASPPAAEHVPPPTARYVPLTAVQHVPPPAAQHLPLNAAQHLPPPAAQHVPPPAARPVSSPDAPPSALPVFDLLGVSVNTRPRGTAATPAASLPAFNLLGSSGEDSA